MPNLYELERQALTLDSIRDAEIRLQHRLEQARSAAHRAGQSIRSALPWRAGGPAPQPDGVLLS